jgi:general secretion pathway protein I
MRARHSDGFTLLEVMVALVIVALSLTAIAATMSQMIGAAATMRDRTYASWIAQNRIAEIRLSLQAPSARATSGEVEYANVDWTWRAVVAETGVPDLFRIDVAVSFAGSDDVVRSVTGFIGAPSAAGTANNVYLQQIRVAPGGGPTS